MADTTLETIDLVEELRLRRWARLNYAPQNRRDSEWHPVILDEMRRKDGESRQREQHISHYVPLELRAPLVHQRHQVEAPFFFTTPAPVEELHYT